VIGRALSAICPIRDTSSREQSLSQQPLSEDPPAQDDASQSRYWRPQQARRFWWQALALAVISASLGAGAMLWLLERSQGPGRNAAPEPAREELSVPAPPLAAGQPQAVEELPEIPGPRLEYPGETVNGLQMVVSPDRHTCAPGETVNFLVKFVNHTDRVLRYVYDAPEVHVATLRTGRYSARQPLPTVTSVYGGSTGPPGPDKIKELPAGGEATHSYVFTWPRYKISPKASKPVHISPGIYQVALVYSAARPTPPLVQDSDGPPLWEGLVRSGTFTLTIAGRAPLKTYPLPSPPPKVEEEF
jgi:hypothetical protein